jgi:hypothetical protein
MRCRWGAYVVWTEIRGLVDEIGLGIGLVCRGRAQFIFYSKGHDAPLTLGASQPAALLAAALVLPSASAGLLGHRR